MKIFSVILFLCLFSANSVCYANQNFDTKIRHSTYKKINVLSENLPSVAIFVIMPPSVENPVKSAEEIYEEVKNTLEETGKLRALPFENSQKIYRSYARENFSSEYFSSKQINTTMVDDGYFNFLPRKNDFLTLGKNLNADYIIYITARTNRQSAKGKPFPISLVAPRRIYQTNLYELVMFDIKNEDYLLDKINTITGATSGSYSTGDRAFSKSLKDFLQNLDFDKIKINDNPNDIEPFFKKQKSDSWQNDNDNLKNFSSAKGTLGTSQILLYDTNIASWHTKNIEYSKNGDTVLVNGYFQNNSNFKVIRVKNMQMNIVLLDENGTIVKIFSARFNGHELNMSPNETKLWTYKIEGIPWESKYADNWHISYNAQYSVKTIKKD